METLDEVLARAAKPIFMDPSQSQVPPDYWADNTVKVYSTPFGMLDIHGMAKVPCLKTALASILNPDLIETRVQNKKYWQSNKFWISKVAGGAEEAPLIMHTRALSHSSSTFATRRDSRCGPERHGSEQCGVVVFSSAVS